MKRCTSRCMCCRPSIPSTTAVWNAPTALPASSSGGRYDGPLSIDPVQAALAGYEFFYNYERPHAALDWKTPNEYLVTLEAA